MVDARSVTPWLLALAAACGGSRAARPASADRAAPPPDPPAPILGVPRAGLDRFVLAGGRPHEAPQPLPVRSALAFRPDGAVLAVGGRRELQLWDVASGRRILELDGLRTPIVEVAYRPDGGALLARGLHAMVVVVGAPPPSPPPDLELGDPAPEDGGRAAEAAAEPEVAPPVRRIEIGHAASAAVWHPDGRTLAVAIRDAARYRIVLLETSSLEERVLATDLRARDGVGLAFDPTGRHLVATGVESGPQIWHLESDERSTLSESRATAIAFSADGAWIALGGRGGWVELLDASGVRRWSASPPGLGSVRDLAFDPAGRRLAAASAGNVVALSVADGARLDALVRHDDEPGVGAMAWTAGDALAVLRGGGRLDLWQPGRDPVSRPVDAHHLAISADRRRLALQGAEAFAVWDAVALVPERRLGVRRRVPTAIAWSADGDRFAAGLADGGVWIWDLRDGTVVRGSTSHDGAVSDAAFTPDGGRLVTIGGGLATLRFWDTSDGRNVGTVHAFEMFADGLHGVARLTVTDSLVVVDDGAEAVAFEARRGRRIEAFGPTLGCAVPSPDGTRVAICEPARVPVDPDGDLEEHPPVDAGIWSLATRTRELSFHGTPLRAAWSPDGGTLLLAYADRLAAVDGATLAPLGDVAVQAAEAPIVELVVSPDGARVGALEERGSFVAWSLAGDPPGRRWGGVNDFGWSSDGELHALAGSSGRVRLLDREGELRGTLPAGEGAAAAVAFRPGGAVVARAADVVRLARAGSPVTVAVDVVDVDGRPRLIAWSSSDRYAGDPDASDLITYTLGEGLDREVMGASQLPSLRHDALVDDLFAGALPPREERTIGAPPEVSVVRAGVGVTVRFTDRGTGIEEPTIAIDGAPRRLDAPGRRGHDALGRPVVEHDVDVPAARAIEAFAFTTRGRVRSRIARAAPAVASPRGAVRDAPAPPPPPSPGCPSGMARVSPTLCMDRVEVTVADYARCVSDGACAAVATPPGSAAPCNWPTPGRDLHPMNCVTWDAARSHCRVRGARLPTRAEWELAAGAARFPWGDEAATTHRAHFLTDVGEEHWPTEGTTGVGHRPDGATEAGVHDLVGNVAEWVADGDRSSRVVMGGGFLERPRETLVAVDSRPPDRDAVDVGFRCVAEVER